MKRYMLFFAYLWLISCDSGDIWPENKQVEEIKMNVNAVFYFKNTGAFPQNYRVVWGAFVGASPYPLAFEEVEKPTGSVSWSATPWQTVPRGATHAALALVEQNENKAIYTFQTVPLDNAAAELRVSDTVDLAAFARVQAQVFTPQCIQCHGAGGLAVGLDLTAGNAYADLVNVPSNAANSPKNRVTKYNLQNSFLLDVLTSRPATVTTNHTTLSTFDAVDDVELIKAWITAEDE